MFADMGKHSTDKEGIHDSFMHTLLWYARAAPRVPPWGTAVAAAKASHRGEDSDFTWCFRLGLEKRLGYPRHIPELWVGQ